jgi:hypothetical protein
MDDYDKLKLLFAELAQAEAVFDGHPAHGQTLALLAVIKWLDSVGVTSSPLSSIAVGMFDAVNKRHSGGAIRGVLETRALAEAAAFVTKQVNAGFPLKDVLKDVCSKAGLDEKQVRKFRDNVSRGRISGFARGMYEDYLSRM